MISRLLCCTALWVLSLTASAGTIVAVPTDGLKGADGVLRCALWVKADGFPGTSEAAAVVIESPINGPVVSCTFEGVDAGIYAISLLHDANKNGQMDISERGMPREGYGTSNDVPAQKTSPPSFEDAQFKFDGKTLNVSMQMRYPKKAGPQGPDGKGQTPAQ